MTALSEVQAAVRSRRHRYSDEISLHLSLAECFDEAGVPYEREVQVAGGRIDFLVEGWLGVEVKVRGTTDALIRQLRRYDADPRILHLLVVTTRSQHAYARVGVGIHQRTPVDVTVIGALS